MPYGKHKSMVSNYLTVRLFIHYYFLNFYLTQTGIYGALFRRNKEAAFSNYRLWESAGFVIAYAYSRQLCARMKLYVLFAVLALGMVGYAIVEIRQAAKVSKTLDQYLYHKVSIIERCERN